MINIKILQKCFYLCLLFSLFSLRSVISYSLVGVEEVKKKGNKNINSLGNKKNQTSTNKKNKTTKTQIKELKTGKRTDDIPEFPKDGVEEYKMLFDDGFSNVVEDEFQSGENFDIFVDRQIANDINRNYIAGNDDFITQMDVIEAEKKTIIDNNAIDKNSVTTYRTRVMAYLTIEQMLYADMFRTQPHGFYVNAVQKK